MKNLFALAVCASLAVAAYGADDDIAVTLGAPTVLSVAGASAAFAIDASLVDAVAANGVLTLFGRSAGATQVVVVTPSATRTFRVVVAEDKTVTRAREHRAISSAGGYITRYSSADGRLYSTVALSNADGSSESDIRLTSVIDRSNVSLPFFTYRMANPRRTVTFFDETVDNSPLTLTGTTLRGLHWRQGAFSLHAGVVSVLNISSFFIPVERKTAIGASYAIRRGALSTFTPSLYFYPGRGATGSLMYDYQAKVLQTRIEFGLSRGVGGSAELNWERQKGEHLNAEFKYVPRRFVSVSSADNHGLSADASWNRLYMRRLTIDTGVSMNRYELPNFSQSSLTGHGDARYAVTDSLSVLTGASYWTFSGNGVSSRNIAVPFGASYESSRFGASLIPRWTEGSATNHGGLGYRVSGRLDAGALQFSAYMDRQKDALTVDAIFKEHPELALAFAELGIVATTPEDIVRLVHENASLIGLGVLNGLTVNVAPVRSTASFEAAWLGRTTTPQEIRLRVLRSRTEGAATTATSSIATLGYVRHLPSGMDVSASASLWESQFRNERAVLRRSVEIGVHGHLDKIPSLAFLHRSGEISGMVFGDERMVGTYAAGAVGISGVEVELDGAKKAVSDRDGHYSFASVRPGSHRIAARLQNPASYFTTPSSVTLVGTGRVDFGVSRVPAHLVGHVRNDVGHGIEGVTVTVARGTQLRTVLTEGDGKFSLALPPGEYEASIDVASLPTGYRSRGETRHLSLDRAAPATVEFEMNVNRSISGQTSIGEADVEIAAISRKTHSTADGVYAFRSLPPGEFTIVASRGGTTHSRSVTLSEQPATLTGIDLLASDNKTSVGAAIHTPL
jgi:hypothetical protein